MLTEQKLMQTVPVVLLHLCFVLGNIIKKLSSKSFLTCSNLYSMYGKRIRKSKFNCWAGWHGKLQ